MDSNPIKGGRKFFSLKQLSRRTIALITIGVVVSLGATAYLLFFTGPSFTELNKLLKKSPQVKVATETQNPFKKESQFVNPFDTSKSQIFNLKEKAAAQPGS